MPEEGTDVDELLPVEHLLRTDGGIVVVQVLIPIPEDVEAASEDERFQLGEDRGQEGCESNELRSLMYASSREYAIEDGGGRRESQLGQDIRRGCGYGGAGPD